MKKQFEEKFDDISLLNLKQRFQHVLESAMVLAGSGSYKVTYDGIFAPGSGVAWKCFRTSDDRLAFVKSDEYSKISAILSNLLKDNNNDARN